MAGDDDDWQGSRSRDLGLFIPSTKKSFLLHPSSLHIHCSSLLSSLLLSFPFPFLSFPFPFHSFPFPFHSWFYVFLSLSKTTVIIFPFTRSILTPSCLCLCLRICLCVHLFGYFCINDSTPFLRKKLHYFLICCVRAYNCTYGT